MFVDLVGSTALSARLDPEDLRELIGAYHRRVAAAVERPGGFVAKYMGDGVLAYFGYPRAHEDDAERAIRAGLELVAAVRDLEAPAGTALRVRVGIATGLVVVGDLLGSGAAREQAVVGETPNLAARLQALAEPDSVVIAEATRRLVGGLFECARPRRGRGQGLRRAGAGLPRPRRRRGGEPVRGVPRRGPGAAGRARGGAGPAAAALGAGQGRRGPGRPALGRGRGRQVAAAGGAAGAARPTSRTLVLRYFCSPHRQDSPLHPVIAQLERAAGFARGDPPEARLAKLEALLAPTSPPAEDVALLAELLSLPPGDRHAAPPLAPQRKRERTFAALLRQLERLSDREPGADGLRGRALDRPELARAARPRGRARGPAAGSCC